jgi:histidine ammonia-lyase
MTHQAIDDRPTIFLGGHRVTIEEIVALARGSACVKLDTSAEFRNLIASGAARFYERLEAGEKIYGVTTGFGESCLNDVPPPYIADLPDNLVLFHGCGVGALLDDEQSAAVVAVCLAGLASGWAAVRLDVLERLADLLNHRILPLIPCQGSVGASGDLTPLSYVAAVLLGDREVSYGGEPMPTEAAFRAAGLDPLRFRPKESLALMNGTGVMTALLCLAYDRAARLARLTAALTAMLSDVMRGNPAHFDERIFAAKPHRGMQISARWIREDIGYTSSRLHDGRIQDRYSIRCAPHVIGVLIDALLWMRDWIETEVNGASINPLVDPETGDVLHGGNFYGGHACFAADALKNAVANLADLMDRQMALLCSPTTSNGLPENLVGREGADRFAHHGFKAMQIAASALAAEALKLTMPASVFSRSTECHNQDKVSMGTIAARDALRVLEMTETLAAICTLAACQAVDLRRDQGCHGRALAIRNAVRQRVSFNDRDRRQDRDIDAVLEMIRKGELPIGRFDLA